MGSENKPTRQWDAWTREEEEKFFGALRQVGKNFEKITSRVQSKNKDQVRHYYYRVIKRMNRILAPTLILDAKNSTYVNSAMLRWWSLLEKHSCSASKLRLKPRRFKTFVTALEHQLLQDHKRVKVKRPTPPAATSRKHVAHAYTTAVVTSGMPNLVTSGPGVSKDSADKLQSGQSAGAGKIAVKRKAASNGMRKSASKGDARRPPRPHKRPTGQIPPGTSAAFSDLGLTDKLGKELPSGVASVETYGLDVPAPSRLRGNTGSPQNVCLSLAMLKPSSTSKRTLPHTYKGVSGGQIIIPELSTQVMEKLLDVTRCNNCSILRCNGPEELRNDSARAKMKLQLFPFDDFTRKALEQDGHNPHLELTLKARKSISSVLNHLVQKWGRSTVASGELCLFPFNTQWSNMSACQSWNFQDLNVSAADVHAAIGSPAMFRLRYAWLSTRLLDSSSAVLQQQHIHASSELGPVPYEGASYPATQSSNVMQQTSVLPRTSTSPSICVRMSTVTSVELSRPSHQIQPFEVSTNVSRKEDVRQVVEHAVPAHRGLGVDVHVTVPSVESIQRPALCPVLEHGPVNKLNGSNEAPDVTAELHTDMDIVQLLPDLASVAGSGTENADRSNYKEHDSASQISGCAWLYESNDGFAQKLWSYEDTLRSSSGVSLAQMDWVDSLTNISVSELLGEASRAVCSAPSDCPQPCSSQSQLTCLDAFDLSIAGQELPVPSLMSMPPAQSSSSAIWGGDDTCDAFSFQRLDRRRKDIINSLGEETSANSLGLDVAFADFRSLACWRDGESLVSFNLAQQPQHCQSQDLLFGGEASVGLGGLIEALAEGSLDEFQACSINHDAEEGDIDQATRQGWEGSREERAENGDACAELPSNDGTDWGILGNLCEQGRMMSSVMVTVN